MWLCVSHKLILGVNGDITQGAPADQGLGEVDGKTA